MNLMHLVSQIIGDDMEMAYYPTSITYVQILSVYWMI